MSWFAGLFDHLEQETCDALEAARRSATFATGEDVSQVGDLPERLHLIRAGKVKVWRPARSGGALTLYYMSAGAPIGLLTIVRGGTLPVTVTATAPLETWYWSAALTRRLLHRDAHFAANGMRILGGALGSRRINRIHLAGLM